MMTNKAWASVALCVLCGTCAAAWTPAPVAAALSVSRQTSQLAAYPKAYRITTTARRRALHMVDEHNNDQEEDHHHLSQQQKQQQQQQQDENNNNTGASEADDDELEFQKAVRVAKAQAEIDRILNSPDAPFDHEAELKKVSNIGSTSAIPTKNEQIIEEKVDELETGMYTAIKNQDFELAASKKQQLGKMHVDDCGAVLQVNSAFYKAFSEKDYKAMENLWLKDNSVLCIHPAHVPLVGNKDVLASWKDMFESTDGSFQRNWMTPCQIRLAVKGTTAIVTCDEEVYARRFVRGQKRQTELINKLVATNIFRKVGGKWYMVHHHASWHADSDAAKSALNNQRSPPERTSGMLTIRGNRRSTIMGSDGKMMSSDKSNIISPDAKSGSSGDGIMGMTGFGPLLGPSASSSSENGSTPEVKRVFMGSLSDLLNGLERPGGLGDILSSGSTGQEDGSDDGGNTELPIIESIEETDTDDDEDDDENYDDDDENENNTKEAVTIMKQWANKYDGTSSSGDNNSLSKQSVSSSQGNNSNARPKDAIRQNCISALRKLCDQGSISPKQKRLLLTDIITCSAKGEFSMVEVAYELLCGEGEDNEISEEEFADQCRVFALSLPESPSSQVG